MASLSWPTTIVVIAWLFQSQIRDLLRRVKELTMPGGINATFGDKLEEVRQTAEASLEIAAVQESTGQDGTRTTLAEDEPFLQLAQSYPQAAILKSYKDIENLLRKFVPPGKAPNHLSFMRTLADDGRLPADLWRAYTGLRQTRNVAVHSNEGITPGEAMEYRDLCRRFMQAVRPHLEALSLHSQTNLESSVAETAKGVR